MRAGSGTALVVALLLSACATTETSVADGRADNVTCTPDATVEDRPIRVVTTVAPITNIVSMIAADADVIVEGLVPEGVNSHTWGPGPSAVAAMEVTDVVFLNGLDLEAGAKRLALANATDAVAVCELGDEVLPESEYVFDFSFPESAGSPNPHLWTNPPMAREYAAVVRDLLTAIDPAGTATYEANDAAFAAGVDALDAAVRGATATLPPDRRRLLTYHDAYAYFAEEYGWTVVGAVQPSSFAEPSPRELAALIEQVRDESVPVIFGSDVFPSPVLQQIATETGADYVDDLRDDDLPGDVGDPDHSWFGLMQFNFVTMIEALGGDASAIASLDLTPTSPDRATYAG